jgi:hypothetical protein
VSLAIALSVKITDLTLGGNDVKTQFPSISGLNYTLQHSTNLKDWMILQKNIVGKAIKLKLPRAEQPHP